jgi:hypothetical protein
MEWKPISTAPKDGRTILIRQGDLAPCHAYWRYGAWQAVEYYGCPRYPTHFAEINPPTLKAQSPETDGE